MGLRRLAWLGLLALVIAGALAWGFWPRPLVVDAAPADRGPLTVTVEEEGKTRVTDRFQVSAPVAGYARRITLEVGDGVEQGQVLVHLEPVRSEVLDPRSRAEAQARVASARAALQAAGERAEAAAAQADYAAAELKRIQGLFASRHASEDAVERARAEARAAAAEQRSAQFNVKVARFELEAARTALEYAGAGPGSGAETVAIRAPVAGRVLKIQHKSEGAVQAGTPLLEIGDPRSLEVEVDVLSQDAVRIRPGTPVRFERWGGGNSLEGVVRTVEPVGFTKISALGVEEQRVWVIADFTSPRSRWERLGDGYRVEASFVLWEGDDVLRIPASALFRHDQGWAVFVIEGGRARRRGIEIGHRTGIHAEVSAGLEAGEVVITHPDDAIEDGVRVRVRGGQ